MLYVIDNTENEDLDEGIFGWLVSLDESGEDDDEIVAVFRQEKMAELFVEYANSDEGKPVILGLKNGR